MTYHLYIMTNHSKTLYTGVTSDLRRRAYEHKHKLVEGFTKRYNLMFLVYYEETSDIYSAISREIQIKGWLRRKKITLIESVNPQWLDLSNEWFEGSEQADPSLRSGWHQQLAKRDNQPHTLRRTLSPGCLATGEARRHRNF